MALIDGHIVEYSQLTTGGLIIDAGCRGFSLARTLGPNYKYLCFDPDKSIVLPDELAEYKIAYVQAAISKDNGTVNYCGWSTGEGNYVYSDKAPHYAEVDYKVPGISLQNIYQHHGQAEWLKIDIEGGEYDVLLHLDVPVAKQISVEFHQCLGHNKHGTHQQYMDMLMQSKFGELYNISEFYEYPNIAGMYEYLFILK